MKTGTSGRVTATRPADFRGWEVPEAGRPGGYREVGYWRLHGSPHLYRSSYEVGRLTDLAQQLEQWGQAVWHDAVENPGTTLLPLEETGVLEHF